MRSKYRFHFKNPIPLNWGESDPNKRGPVVATVKHGGQRNAVGAHGGSCSFKKVIS